MQTPIEKIPVSKPMLDERESEYVQDALRKGELSGFSGEYIPRFECEFSSYSDCQHGVAVSNGTTALHLALVACGIGPGDEVLVSSLTNMATFFAVLYQGAKPIPIDVEMDTWNIDPALIESKISKKTKAILAVHLYGHPADMSTIAAIAKKHGLRLIEDAAEAHGAIHNGKKVGAWGDIGCFSFYANKIITTGEGGMLTTQDPKLAEKARSLRSLAFGKENKFMHEDIGYNYRMTNLQAAIGCAQMSKIEKIVEGKRRVAELYRKELEKVSGLTLPIERKGNRNVYWMYHVLLKGEHAARRSSILKELGKLGIETREGFVPYNAQKIFVDRGWTQPSDCPRAVEIGNSGFYLPSAPDLTSAEIQRIGEAVRKLIK